MPYQPIVLSEPTEVNRTGATLVWHDLGNMPDGDGHYAYQGAFLPGLSGKLVRLELDAPDDPLTVLPAVLAVSVTLYASPGTDVSTWVVDDTACLGTAVGGPLWTNKATGTKVPDAPTTWVYHLPTEDIPDALDKINSGTLWVFLGYSAVPTDADAYLAARWAISVSPSSPQSHTGKPSVSYSPTCLVTAVYSGPGDVPPGVGVTVTAFAQGKGGADSPFSIFLTGSANVANGLGATASGSIASPTEGSPPESRECASSSVLWAKQEDDSGARYARFYPTGSVSVSGDAHQYAQVYDTWSVSATPVAPSATTLYVDSVSCEYWVDDSGPGHAGEQDHCLKGPLAHQHVLSGLALT